MASEAELKELERKQRELMKNATPAQRAEIQTQNMIIKGQLKKAPQELPIDKDAKFEAQSPERGGRKSRRKGRKTRKSKKVTRRRHRGGEGINVTQYGVEGRKESVVRTAYDKEREKERKWDARNRGMFETKSTEYGVNKSPSNPVNTQPSKLPTRSGGRKSKKVTRRR
jgi:hypothetical protein